MDRAAEEAGHAMILNEPSTINGWIARPGPINLRTAPRKIDPVAGAGLVYAIGFAAALTPWLWLLVWSLSR